MADSSKALLIKVNNAADLARSQGAMASLAQSIAPATIEGQVYKTLQAKLQDALTAQGVQADITVVDPRAFTHESTSPVWTDLALGMGFVGVAYLAYDLFGKKK